MEAAVSSSGLKHKAAVNAYGSLCMYVLDFLLGEWGGGEGLESMLLTKELRNCQKAFWHLAPVFSFSVSFSIINPQVFIYISKRSSHGPSPFTLPPNRDSVGAIPWLSPF